MANKISVQGNEISIIFREQEDYISLTDMAKYRNKEDPFAIINNWMRSRSTIEFLGLWEKLSNPDFNPIEFERLRSEAGSNYFVLSPKRWIESTHARGIISKSGRYGGTYAHKDIAFEFATWISPEFKLYLIKEFQRLKADELKQLGWDIRRNLVKINYRIHTDAIRENLVPPELSARQINLVYATEADVLNMALFGMTAKDWRNENPGRKGNIRDYADVSQLVCLSNLENLNALFIQENVPQAERLGKLNRIAIHQMKLLTDAPSIKQLEGRDK